SLNGAACARSTAGAETARPAAARPLSTVRRCILIGVFLSGSGLSLPLSLPDDMTGCQGALSIALALTPHSGHGFQHGADRGGVLARMAAGTDSCSPDGAKLLHRNPPPQAGEGREEGSALRQRRVVARVDRMREVLLLRPGPELADVVIGLDDLVPELEAV